MVLKKYLTVFLRFLAFQNSHWSSKYDEIHGSDSKFEFLFKNKGNVPVKLQSIFYKISNQIVIKNTGNVLMELQRIFF